MQPTRGPNRTIYGAIGGVSEIFFRFSIANSTNQEDFLEFIQQLFASVPYPLVQILLVLDNAPSHHSNLVRDYLRATGVEALFLPAYSSTLNPAEHIWSAYKARWSKHLMNVHGDYTVQMMTHDLEQIGLRLGE